MNLISEKRVKARKEHICSWCYNKIKSGEEYFDAVTANDGDIYHWRECDLCKDDVFDMMSCKDRNFYKSDPFNNTYDSESFEMFIRDKYNLSIKEYIDFKNGELNENKI